MDREEGYGLTAEDYGATPAPAPLTLTPIDVDVDGLKNFRELLVRELDANLRPAAAGISNDHRMGPQFGIGNPGAHIQGARERYAKALEAATNNLAQYVITAEIMIETIQKIAAKYTDADVSAGGSFAGVRKELIDTMTADIEAREAAANLLVDQETQREFNRMYPGTDR